MCSSLIGDAFPLFLVIVQLLRLIRCIRQLYFFLLIFSFSHTFSMESFFQFIISNYQFWYLAKSLTDNLTTSLFFFIRSFLMNFSTVSFNVSSSYSNKMTLYSFIENTFKIICHLVLTVWIKNLLLKSIIQFKLPLTEICVLSTQRIWSEVMVKLGVKAGAASKVYLVLKGEH